MLALGQGDQLNLSKLAGSLGVDAKTIRKYLDILTDLYMVRQLRPWAGNSRKRLVKSPKIFVRDTGVLHSLINISSFDELTSNPLCGASWEGFVIENILAHLTDSWIPSYYRTGAQAEIDLVLEGPGGETVAIEIKRTLTPKPSKGFKLGAEDIGATRRYFVIPIEDRLPLAKDIEAIGILPLLSDLMD